MTYYYYLCPECEFDMVLAVFKHRNCPACREDNEHHTTMTTRPALDSDRPEGRDERINLMKIRT